MQSIADRFVAPYPQDPLERELREVEALRERALASPALLHCSPAARYLVREEIPRLVALIRDAARRGEEGAPADLRSEVVELLRALRHQAEIIRDLVERA